METLVAGRTIFRKGFNEAVVAADAEVEVCGGTFSGYVTAHGTVFCRDGESNICVDNHGLVKVFGGMNVIDAKPTSRIEICGGAAIVHENGGYITMNDHALVAIAGADPVTGVLPDNATYIYRKVQDAIVAINTNVSARQCERTKIYGTAHLTKARNITVCANGVGIIDSGERIMVERGGFCKILGHVSKIYVKSGGILYIPVAGNARTIVVEKDALVIVQGKAYFKDTNAVHGTIVVGNEEIKPRFIHSPQQRHEVNSISLITCDETPVVQFINCPKRPSIYKKNIDLTINDITGV